MLKDAGNLLMFVGNGTDGAHQLHFQQKDEVLCKHIPQQFVMVP